MLRIVCITLVVAMLILMQLMPLRAFASTPNVVAICQDIPATVCRVDLNPLIAGALLGSTSDSWGVPPSAGSLLAVASGGVAGVGIDAGVMPTMASECGVTVGVEAGTLFASEGMGEARAVAVLTGAAGSSDAAGAGIAAAAGGSSHTHVATPTPISSVDGVTSFEPVHVPAQGDYTTTVPIVAPPFRDVTPELSLQYGSSLGNGYLGVGWRIGGFSLIERVSTPSRSTPNWDTTDRYVLDGEDLVADTSLGGTHSTKRQSFRRITQDPGTNSWKVEDKDGKTTTYTSVFDVAGKGTLRWGVSSVSDPNGNMVSYTWWCDGAADCYPQTITYPGVTITFIWELRPAEDRVTFKISPSDNGTMNYRLSSVTTTGLPTYTFTYVTSPVTSRSILRTIQREGLPAMTFTASEERPPGPTCRTEKVCHRENVNYSCRRCQWQTRREFVCRQVWDSLIRTWRTYCQWEFTPEFVCGWDTCRENREICSDVQRCEPTPVTQTTHLTTDLIVSVENGFGATTTITYANANSFPDTALPDTAIPKPRMVVTNVSTSDGRGGSTSKSFSYSGGQWDTEDNRLLGFRYIKTTDLVGFSDETYFLQGVAYPVGTAEYTYRGNRLAYDRFVYSISPAAPYKTMMTDHYIAECDATGANCRLRRTGFEYDDYGRTTAVLEYGEDGVSDAGERTTLTSYAVVGNYVMDRPALVTVRKGLGLGDVKLTEKRFAYDERGNQTLVEEWRDTTDSFIPTLRATYDTFGNRKTETDAANSTTTTDYEATYSLFPERVTNALGHVTSMTWSRACGAKTSLIDANRKETRWQYDALCRLVREIRADGSDTATSFESFGTIGAQHIRTATSDGTADDLWKKSYFDGRGRTYREVSEPDQIADTVYDNRGLVASVSALHLSGEAEKLTLFEYDALGRVMKQTHPDGSVVQTMYSPWSVTSINELGNRTERVSNAFGQVSATREFTGTQQWETQVAYDALGRVSVVTDAMGNQTRYLYDSLGRRTEVQDPDLGTWRYSHNDAGWLQSTTDAKGQTIQYEYDALGRVKRKTLAAAVLANFEYDEVGHGASIGRVATQGHPWGKKQLSYDELGRVTLETDEVDGVSYSVGTAYDAAGRVKSITYPDGEVVTHEYDAAGRLIRVGPYVEGASYDARGNLLSRTLGNGVREDFAYHPSRFWLTGVSVTKTTGTESPIQQLNFGYDLTGRVMSRSSPVDAREGWTFAYDDLGRLIGVTNAYRPEWSETFTYDVIGNMTFQSSRGVYTYRPAGSPRPHAPTAVGDWTLSYDDNGNLIGIPGMGLTFRYDAENRLVEVNGTRHIYDATGARVKEGNRIFIGKLYEMEGASATKYYFFGKSRIARRDVSTGAIHYYHADHIGTRHRMTDATGSAESFAAFSSFGRRLEATGTTDSFGMAGERLDESGLYHMGARFMSPQIGRFITPDPSDAVDPAKPQTLNRYAYALNNPVNLVDPTGYFAWDEDWDDGWGDAWDYSSGWDDADSWRYGYSRRNRGGDSWRSLADVLRPIGIGTSTDFDPYLPHFGLRDSRKDWYPAPTDRLYYSIMYETNYGAPYGGGYGIGQPGRSTDWSVRPVYGNGYSFIDRYLTPDRPLLSPHSYRNLAIGWERFDDAMQGFFDTHPSTILFLDTVIRGLSGSAAGAASPFPFPDPVPGVIWDSTLPPPYRPRR